MQYNQFYNWSQVRVTFVSAVFNWNNPRTSLTFCWGLEIPTGTDYALHFEKKSV